jgi:NADPH2:quinone reductase
LYETGKMKPLVGATFPLEETAAALAHLSNRQAIGKTVITMGG